MLLVWRKYIDNAVDLVLAAPIVCRVEKIKCPVSAAVIATCIVS